LDSEKWYSITKKEILSAGGRGILKYHKGSHIRALVKLYPELRLKKKFFHHSKEGWKSPQKQRSFLDTIAKFKQFDPLDAKQWYSITPKDIKRAGGRSILYHHRYSLVTVLTKVYPELALDAEKFNFIPNQAWKTSEQRREFFDKFAQSKKFNPLDAAKWYSVTSIEIKNAGGSGILYYYKGSHIKALIALYPELMLKTEIFLSKVNKYSAFLQR